MPITPEQRETVLRSVVDGISVRKACEAHGVSRGEFYFDLIKDPDFADQYARAMELRGEGHADDTIDVADGTADGFVGKDAADRRLSWDARRWAASKMAPKKYGDKLAIGGAHDLPPIRTLDASKLSPEAMAEILAAAGNATPETDAG